MLPFDDARVLANTGKRGSSQRVMKPLWKFAQHGECGPLGVGPVPGDQPARRRPLLHPLDAHRGRGARPGDALPALRVDELDPARRWARGCSTAWAPRTRTCPASSRSRPSAGNGGARNYGNAFLPAGLPGHAAGQGRRPRRARPTIRNLTNPLARPSARRRELDLLRELNAEQLRRTPGDSELEAVVASYELAWRMQSNAPDVLDLSRESKETQALYGIGDARRPTTSAASA